MLSHKRLCFLVWDRGGLGTWNDEDIEVSGTDFLVINGMCKTYAGRGGDLYYIRGVVGLQSGSGWAANVVEFEWSGQAHNFLGKTANGEVFGRGHAEDVDGGQVEELDYAGEEDADSEFFGHIGSLL
jgi:hypothetical protein